MSEPTCEEHAAMGLKAVRCIYSKDLDSGGVDLKDAITDTVANLLHLAHENDIEPDYIIHMATMHYDAEVEEAALGAR